MPRPYPDSVKRENFCGGWIFRRHNYKVGEAILRAIGKPKKWDALVGLGWTTNDELRRFTKSTHERRHHAVPGPDKPMNDSEARTYVRGLLDKLIAHLDSTGP